MDIIQYLISLLKSSKQVGVEGLGTFYKSKTPGRYDAATHSFLPPSYVLQFTPDELELFNLKNHIQEQRNVSEETANYFIQQFVSELKEKLQHEPQVLENIGTLTHNNGKIDFVASENINTGADFFALPAINVKEQPAQNANQSLGEVTDEKIAAQPEIEQVKAPDFEHEINKVENIEEPNVETAEQPENTEEIVSTSASSIQENEATDEEVYEEISEVNSLQPVPTIVEQVEEQKVLANEIYQEKLTGNEYQGTSEDPLVEEEKKSTLLRTISIVILAILFILAIVYFLKPDLFNRNNQAVEKPKPTIDSTLKTQQDSLAYADSIMQNAEKVGLEVKPAKDTLKVTTTAKPVNAITYDIIGAAFAKLSEADEYIKIMKQKGFDAKIANMPGKIYKKISIASYNNQDTAQKYVEIYRKELNNPKMYVQQIKNK